MPHVSAGEHHKGFQQVQCSSAHFHFVQQRESLYHWLASESLAWSFFYGPSFPECTIFTGAHDNRAVMDKVDRGWWGIWGGGSRCPSQYIQRGRPGDGEVCGTHSSGRMRLWYARLCVRVGLFVKWPWPQFPSVATSNRNRMRFDITKVETHFSYLFFFCLISLLTTDWLFFCLKKRSDRKTLQLFYIFYIEVKSI